MKFKRKRDLFIEFIADCIAYIIALAIVILLPLYSLFQWIFSLFKRFYTLVKDIRPIYKPAIYPLIIFYFCSYQ
jgi:hypothetical protein